MPEAELVDKYVQRAREEKQHYWIWTLFTIGILLVCFAGLLGPLIVLKDEHGGYLTDQAQDAATTVRLLGVMAFVTGLAERVIMVLSRKSA